MKRFFALAAAGLLLCHPTFSQDVSFSGIARYENTIPDWGFGNSSFYTLLEGSFSEHVSYTLCNHWLAEDPAWLYEGTLHSDTTNWLDYCCLDFNFGGFGFTLGKDALMTGGWEFDPWDYDVFTPLTTTLWNDLAVYQWGAAVHYTTPSERTSLQFQFKTSPFGERPFASGLFAYSLGWTGSYGPVETRWSAVAAGTGRKEYTWILSAGQRFNILDNLSFTADYNYFLGHIVSGSLQYRPWHAFEATLRGGWERTELLEDETQRWFAGANFCCYPLKDSDNLRLHLTGAYDSLIGGFTANIGITFNFNFFTFE